MNDPILFYDRLDSTMDELKRLLQKGAAVGTVVVADSQTKGRGTKGRKWDSPPGKNLYLSVLVNPKVETIYIPYAVGRALWKTVTIFLRECETASIPSLKLKWPNDVWVDDKKISGILIEKTNVGFIVGIGLNVNAKTSDFSPEVSDMATSLKIVTGSAWDVRKVVLPELFQALRDSLFDLENGLWEEIHRFYEENLYQKNRTVTFSDGQTTTTGVVQGIGEDGALCIETSDKKIHRIFTGDVNLA